VVGGFERVYEINRNFRNEGVSTRHNPEFTMLEFYQAYATYEDLMDLTEEMISEAAHQVAGGRKLPFGEHSLDFSKGWRRVRMTEAIRERLPELSDADFNDAERLRQQAGRSAHTEAERGAVQKMSLGELIGFLFERHVEATLIQPTFVTHFPTAV